MISRRQDFMRLNRTKAMKSCARDLPKGDCNSEEKSFSFFMPAYLSKSAKGVKKGIARIGGVASTEDIDLQGEKVFLDGLEIDYLKSRGIWNWNHDSRSPGSILGEVDTVEKKNGALHVGGFLYDTPQARDVLNLMRAMKSSGSKRQLGFSIEGKIKERRNKEIRKAWLKAIALTYNPINEKTYCTLLDITKSFKNKEFNFCRGNCGHCQFKKAQNDITDAREQTLASEPNPDAHGYVQGQWICSLCGRPNDYSVDICPCQAGQVTNFNIFNKEKKSMNIHKQFEKVDDLIKSLEEEHEYRLSKAAEEFDPDEGERERVYDDEDEDNEDREEDKEPKGVTKGFLGTYQGFDFFVSDDYEPIEKADKTVDYDPREVEMGMEFEKEHSDDPAEQLKIVRDHLDEIVDYYSRLKEMLKQAKAEEKAQEQEEPVGKSYSYDEYNRLVLKKDLNVEEPQLYDPEQSFESIIKSIEADDKLADWIHKEMDHHCNTRKDLVGFFKSLYGNENGIAEQLADYVEEMTHDARRWGFIE